MSNDISLISFQEALAKHIDQSKPDPLARKQLEAWNLQWHQERDAPLSPNNVLNGYLEIHGEHMVLTIDSKCSWTSPTHGTLDFSLRARARFATKKKVIMKRLREDDYVEPLLESKDGLILYEAHIRLDDSELEEKVLIDEKVVQGLRRAVYSQAEDNLSVMELLASLPLLPSDNTLAHRAKLRILEDAMVDECLNEEENDLLDDLSIRKQDDKYNKACSEVEQPAKKKKHK